MAVKLDTGITTATHLGPANLGDAEAAPGLLEDEPAGTEVLGDSAYGSGELRAHLEKEKMTAVIKPGPLRSAVPGGYNIDDFVIDSHAATVTCPEGVTVAIRRSRTARFGANCANCPMRYLCTTATGGRVIKLHPHHDLLVAARVTARTDAFAETYRHDRPMVERSLAWLVRKNSRRLGYRGSARNAMWLAHRAAAVNLMRMVNLGLTHDERGWTMAAE